ncbi:reverse transcriptase-like protein [Paenibacillus sp. Leaf72]|uniref:reverse transcriptase-like protein n=1 Tax=Paenibacillus sp. Leaf72 TaxID=1736234 RepID=UPI000701408A|nr:reverse transcriptase-like protein [Paenibacillus sp. Leaf72]KQN96890.1 hypothetical protein ASF12_22745 [Paenibacillus sp. Leaf72]
MNRQLRFYENKELGNLRHKASFAAAHSPDSMSIGISIEDPSGMTIWEVSKRIRESHFERAVYCALIELLEIIHQLEILRIDITCKHSDIVEQIEADREVAADSIDLFEIAWNQLNLIHNYTLELSAEEGNTPAEDLCILASSNKDVENIIDNDHDILKKAADLKELALKHWNRANHLYWIVNKKSGSESIGWMEQVGPEHYLWHESNLHLYMIDLEQLICSCPEHRKYPMKRCDHVNMLLEKLNVKSSNCG